MGLPLIPRGILDQPWCALITTSALAAAGVITLFSAAGGELFPWAVPHAVRYGAALLVGIVISYLPPVFFRNLVVHAYAGVMVLLVLVLAIGVVRGGARSWLLIGPLGLQPSELMKPTLVIALAAFYAMLPPRGLSTFTAVWPPAMMIAVPAFVILLQPDLGTSLLLILSGITTMFLAGVPLRWFIGGGLASAAAIPAAFPFLMPHQQERIRILLDPSQDPLGAGYHITQSKIAIGSGGITGQGYLNGTQSRLDFLPEQNTDFIFAALMEEWGFVGGMFVLVCLGTLLIWGTSVALRATGRYQKLAAGGITSIIFFYAAINLLMVMGLAPVVGIPLPLVSWGGSAVMTVTGCVGLLMGIDRENRRARRRQRLTTSG